MAAQIQKTKKLQIFKSMISLINWDFQNVCEAEKKPKQAQDRGFIVVSVSLIVCGSIDWQSSLG